MSEITLTAEIRKNVGKRVRAIRKTGNVPGIYYGHGQQNIPVSLPSRYSCRCTLLQKRMSST